MENLIYKLYIIFLNNNKKINSAQNIDRIKKTTNNR